jgi:hypothetical protein
VSGISEREKRRAALALTRMAQAAGAPRTDLANVLEACGLKPYVSVEKVRVR